VTKNLFDSLWTEGREKAERLIPWHRLSPYLGALKLATIRAELRKRNLFDTSNIGGAPQPVLPPPKPEQVYARTADGTYNDLRCPHIGAAGTRFGRNFPLDHVFPEHGPSLLEPSPREVSRKLLARDTFKPAASLNVLAAAWIQFMTHDWFSHGPNATDNPAQIPLVEGDDWPERPMQIARTAPDPTRTPGDSSAPPTYINHVTPWWDGSQLYGSDQVAQDRVRAGAEHGKLPLDDSGLLPLDDSGIDRTGFQESWWLGLALLTNLFVREHNAICDRLRVEYPGWSDEELFLRARLINSALMAKIHTVEWTVAILNNPTLHISMNANWWGLAGEKLKLTYGRLSENELVSGIPGSATDHFGVPFSLTEEFATVYRLHPLVPDEFELRSLNDDRVLAQLTLPEIVGKKARAVQETYAGEEANGGQGLEDLFYSFGISNPGAVTLHNYPRFLRDHTTPDGHHLDLGAVDIFRDRERGVPRYNDFRELVGKPRLESIDELTDNAVWREEIRELYGNDIDRVDLMVGLYAEPVPEGFGFSDTAFRIFILMASRRLNSDRFLSQDFKPEIYTQLGIDWVQKNTMGSVLQRHFPRLTPALLGSDNAFAPWRRSGR
jgi:Animal haem peroxidase